MMADYMACGIKARAHINAMTISRRQIIATLPLVSLLRPQRAMATEGQPPDAATMARSLDQLHSLLVLQVVSACCRFSAGRA